MASSREPEKTAEAPSPPPPAKDATYRVVVPQESGEIVVRRGGEEPVTFDVVDGAISADSAEHAASIAALVGGTVEEAK